MNSTYCGKCGAPLPEGATYCPACNVAVQPAAATPVSAPPAYDGAPSFAPGSPSSAYGASTPAAPGSQLPHYGAPAPVAPSQPPAPTYGTPAPTTPPPQPPLAFGTGPQQTGATPPMGQPPVYGQPMPPPMGYHQPPFPYMPPVEKKVNPLSIVSLVVSLVTLFFFTEPVAIVLALGSIVCGIVALRQNSAVSKLKGLAIAGVAIGVISVLWNIFLLSL